MALVRPVAIIISLDFHQLIKIRLLLQVRLALHHNDIDRALKYN